MSWVHTKFATTLKFYNGKAGTVNERGTYPVYGSNGIIGYCEKPLFENAIIIGRVGAYCGAIQYCKGKFWASDNTIVVKANAGYDVVFLSYLLHIINLNQFAGGSAQPLLTHGWIKPIAVKMPSLPIQQKISGILVAYDDLIENNLRRIKLLEEVARITYEEWFVRLRFPGHESISINSETGLPKGWDSIKCYDAMEVMSGGTPKTSVDAYWNGTIPFYTPKDAVDSSYVFETEKYVTELGVSKCNSKLYPKNTVFITARGTVGKVNLAGLPMAMNQSCYALAGKGGVSPYFLFFAVRDAVEAFKGASNGGVFNTIVVDTFRYLSFTKPTQELIKQFEDFVSPILAEISNLTIQNQRLREARDILLPRLMTGVIDVESYDPARLLKEAA